MPMHTDRDDIHPNGSSGESEPEIQVPPAARTGPRESLLSLKGSLPWRAWLDELAVQSRLNKSMLIDLALADSAKKIGFPKPPPQPDSGLPQGRRHAAGRVQDAQEPFQGLTEMSLSLPETKGDEVVAHSGSSFLRRGLTDCGRCYGLAAAVVALVILLKLLLSPTLGRGAPFRPSAMTVVVSTWCGGLGPCLLATALSAAGAVVLSLPPDRSPWPAYAGPLGQVAAFVVEGNGITCVRLALAARTSPQRERPCGGPKAGPA